MGTLKAVMAIISRYLTMDINKIPWPIMGAVVGVLFSGNVYFANKTIERLDSLEQVVWNMRQEVAVLRATLQPSSFHKGTSHRGLAARQVKQIPL